MKKHNQTALNSIFQPFVYLDGKISQLGLTYKSEADQIRIFLGAGSKQPNRSEISPGLLSDSHFSFILMTKQIALIWVTYENVGKFFMFGENQNFIFECIQPFSVVSFFADIGTPDIFRFYGF